MDKNTIIGFALIGAVLIGFSYWNRPSAEQRAKMQHYNDSVQIAQQQQTMKQLADAQAAQAQVAAMAQDSTSLLFPALQGTEPFVTLETALLQLQLTTKGGRVCTATLKGYNGQDGEPVTLFDGNDAQMTFAFEGKQENIVSDDLYFQPLNVSDCTVTMRLLTNGGGYFDFNYALPANNYMVDFTIQAHGVANRFSPNLEEMSITWHQMARQLEKGYTFENRYSTLTYKPKGKSSSHLSETSDKEKTIDKDLDWVAFKNQFFSCVLIGYQDFREARLASYMKKEGSGYLKEYDAKMLTFFDPTGKQPTEMHLYFGPNHYKTLQKMNALAKGDKDLDMQQLVYLGWPLFRWINRFFTIYVFDWLSNWGLPMGMVLLLMTIIVKLVVFPANYKSYMSSAKMRVLRPYIEEINKKYPNQEDAMKKQQETMALYSRYGVSPMGGCLPMLIQMPVYIALFNFVPNAIELRQQSFLWAPDLSTYDDIISWGTNIPLLGNHLSLFCLLFSLVNILNTMYAMRQQDAMAQQQMPAMKWMMYLMPVMFIFIFNGYSAGLNYYYFISGLITVIIMIVLRKTPDDAALLAKLEANMQSNKDKPRKASNIMAKLDAMQKENERLQREREEMLKKRNKK